MDWDLPNYVDNMTSPTPTERLAAIALGEPLAGWVARARAEGKSWDTIAADLAAETDVRITSEWLRRRHTVNTESQDGAA